MSLNSFQTKCTNTSKHLDNDIIIRYNKDEPGFGSLLRVFPGLHLFPSAHRNMGLLILKGKKMNILYLLITSIKRHRYGLLILITSTAIFMTGAVKIMQNNQIQQQQEAQWSETISQTYTKDDDTKIYLVKNRESLDYVLNGVGVDNDHLVITKELSGILLSSKRQNFNDINSNLVSFIDDIFSLKKGKEIYLVKINGDTKSYVKINSYDVMDKHTDKKKDFTVTIRKKDDKYRVELTNVSNKTTLPDSQNTDELP